MIRSYYRVRYPGYCEDPRFYYRPKTKISRIARIVDEQIFFGYPIGKVCFLVLTYRDIRA